MSLTLSHNASVLAPERALFNKTTGVQLVDAARFMVQQGDGPRASYGNARLVDGPDDVVERYKNLVAGAARERIDRPTYLIAPETLLCYFSEQFQRLYSVVLAGQNSSDLSRAYPSNGDGAFLMDRGAFLPEDIYRGLRFYEVLELLKNKFGCDSAELEKGKKAEELIRRFLYEARLKKSEKKKLLIELQTLAVQGGAYVRAIIADFVRDFEDYELTHTIWTTAGGLVRDLETLLDE